jgi:hypothetical protein
MTRVRTFNCHTNILTTEAMRLLTKDQNVAATSCRLNAAVVAGVNRISARKSYDGGDYQVMSISD